MSLEKPVRTLNPEVARKIAAGEVIDRPNAIVRELIDNSVDSGATSITVEIEEGGIKKIRIVDNGSGMTKEDLQNCAHPHATSKISTEVDLMNLSTLGFRGEALASIAAVARLSIKSGNWKMRASITEDHVMEPSAEVKGTIVQSEGLFENFPARRQFLKRAATEALMCKNTFIEKSLSRPDIAFKFVQDGETKIDLPAGQSIKDRFIQANSYNEAPELFYELNNCSGTKTNSIPDWSFDAVIGEPAVARPTKKDISIYANGRKIQEYSLVQAVEYGGQGFFPNGTYPVAAVFIKIRPDLVDFNIHPAKKEARFYDISDLHHGLSSTIKSFFQEYTYSNFTEDKNTDQINITQDFFETPQPQATQNNLDKTDSEQTDFTHTDSAQADFFRTDFNQIDSSQTDTLSNRQTPIYEKHISYKPSETGAQVLADFRSKFLGVKSGTSGNSSYDFKYESTKAPVFETSSLTPHEKEQSSDTATVKFIGRCLGTFLLAEKNSSLYIIDQHAVHERILFDRIMNSQNGSGRQQLLIPYKIHTESKTQDNQLEKLKPSLDSIGFEINKTSPGLWEIVSTPERWTGTEYDLRTLLFVKQVEPEEIIRSIAAMTACKAAVKDGYVLDDITAARLAQQAFTLKDPHCPHGRPVYTVISREKLFELVKRT